MTHHVDIEEIKSALETFRVKAGKADELEIEMKGLKTRLEKMEIEAARPQFSASAPEGTQEQRDHKKAFEAWLRAPLSEQRKTELANIETRAADGLTAAAGGALVPELILSPLEKQIKDKSAFRSLAKVRQVGTSDVKLPISRNNSSSGWVGETDTRTATTEPIFFEVTPTFGFVYSYVKWTEELGDDSQFDIGDHFIDTISDEIAQAEDTAWITGNGTKRPTGFLNTAPESVGDYDSPARADTALQYLPSGAAAGFQNDRLTSPAGKPDDVLYDTIYSLRAGYRKNAAWLMNSNTAGVARKWKDADGRGLWTDSLVMGQPSMLAGYGVSINEQMPDVGANTFPVAFGDWNRAYLVADIKGLRVTVDDNIGEPGYIRMYVRRRTGGALADNHAARVIKCAVS